MSRIYYSDDYSDNPYLDQGRWEHNSKAVISGKRGQQSLRELEAALLALPEPRLIADTLAHQIEGVDEHASVCALGAYARHKGVDDDDLLATAGFMESAEELADWASHKLGITYTLAWNLIELNDERFAAQKPEQRYLHVLGWVRQNLRREA